MAASQPNHVHSAFYRYRKVFFRRRRLKRPISIAKSMYGYIRTKVTAGRHFRTDLSVRKSERVKEKLSQAYAMADSHAKVRNRANKKRYDERVKKSGLDVGGRVLVRNVVVHQKQKLANHWLADVYIVQRQQGGSSSPVYVMKREDNKGPERVLHRNMLLPCDQLPLPI